MNNLEARNIFRVKNKEGGDSVMDLVILVCQLLRQDLRELQELVDIIELVKSWDEGQPSHVITTQYVSTRGREYVRRTDVLTYRCTEPFTMELGIVLKGLLSLPRQFLLCSKSQNRLELIYQAKYSTSYKTSLLLYLPTYPAH